MVTKKAIKSSFKHAENKHVKSFENDVECLNCK